MQYEICDHNSVPDSTGSSPALELHGVTYPPRASVPPATQWSQEQRHCEVETPGETSAGTCPVGDAGRTVLPLLLKGSSLVSDLWGDGGHVT